MAEKNFDDMDKEGKQERQCPRRIHCSHSRNCQACKATGDVDCIKRYFMSLCDNDKARWLLLQEDEDILFAFDIHSCHPPSSMITKKGEVNHAFIPSDENGLDLAVVEAEVDEESDIWALPELQVEVTPWSELSTSNKVKRVLWHYIGKVILLLGLLYLFICSLSFLGDAFKLLGGKAAGKAFSENEILSNPVAGIMIGILGTVLLQSSSTTTSIVVSMVGSGELLTVKLAIPIVMGANIGTSVTNTIVSFGQITDKNDFRRAFAGATVHDVFNWLTVLVLLPIEIATGYLEKLTSAIVGGFTLKSSEELDRDYLKVITNPFTKLIIQLDKGFITDLALGEVEDDSQSIIKHCCDKTKYYIETVVEKTINGTLTNVTETELSCKKNCKFLFEQVTRKGTAEWSDTTVGVILLIIALVVLCTCLIFIVKLLHSLLRGQMAIVIRKLVNADFPGYCSYFTGYLALLVGVGMTMLLQSSSIFTSSITPLVGMGVISLERMYPLTLGSNIGTTATGILAAFAQDEERIKDALQIALCHLFFNISGILIFYPIPKFRPPINVAKFLGCQTAKYRWFALVYLVVVFFLLPAAGFGLSLVSWIALAAVFVPILLLVTIVLMIKLFQSKCPTTLPQKLRNWKWLPLCLRSLEPYDRLFVKLSCNGFCCNKCRDHRGTQEALPQFTADGKNLEISETKGYIVKEKNSTALGVIVVPQTKL